ncbi:MAG: TIM barrel protein [Bacillota bacterium]
MANTIKFGPAGQSESFINSGLKHTTEYMQWLGERGINAFEYQCNKGVKVGQPTATEIGKLAKEFGVSLSVHAPYYISLASLEEQKRENSITYITDTMRAADWMGATRVIVHSGGAANQDRRTAMEVAKSVLARAVTVADDLGLGHISICPELMGKENQLGSLDEVIEMCLLDDRMLPCIDFGHLNAREQGSMKTIQDFLKVLERLENGLGHDRIKNFHIHFSRIEYTGMGEKRHWNYEDSQFGPDFEPLAEALVIKDLEPTIICESSGKQTEDSVTFRTIYESIKKVN